MNNLIRRNNAQRATTSPEGHDQMLHPYQVMDALLRWNPFRDEAPQANWRGFSPAFEVRETKDAYVIKADVPGLREADIDVTVTANTVTIAGRRDPDIGEDSDQVYALERGYGAFTRTFAMSDGADLEGLTADLGNGVLTVRIPKRPEIQPRKISVGNGSTGSKGSA